MRTAPDVGLAAGQWAVHMIPPADSAAQAAEPGAFWCLELCDRLVECAASRPPRFRRPALLGQPEQMWGQFSAEPLAGLAREQRGQVVDGDDLQRRGAVLRGAAVQSSDRRLPR